MKARGGSADEEAAAAPGCDEEGRRIEDYALIGDGQSAALVHRDGGIDWLCWPRFDSPACFAALLGTDEHGHWSLHAAAADATTTRRYRGGTMVLETDHATRGGRVRVVDFMPIVDGETASLHAIVRIVVGLEGRVAMHHRLSLRFEHGRQMPWVETTDGGFSATSGPHRVDFRSAVATARDATSSVATFDVVAGQRVALVLTHRAADDARQPDADAERLLDATVDHWTRWIARFDRPTAWPDAVERSLLTLHALIDRHNGGLVAAPTTSLPEVPGGTSNWDYRYCWLRDASFTVAALLNAHLHEEAVAWRRWLLRAVGAEPAKLRIAYRIDGSTDLTEREIPWLPGYHGAGPVRVGNAAWSQQQIDVFGEVIDALHLFAQAGIASCAQADHVVAELATHLEQVWDMPGHGLWESRGTPKRYVYSRVMAWVGIDRFLRRGDRTIASGDRSRLEASRDRIHADICARGYHEGLGTFVQHDGGDALDASLLLLPLVGFLPADDPRIERTIDAIERDLMVDGLVMRERPAPGKPEGAFLACTCWFADCRAMQGHLDEARAALERVLAVANDVGLLSEEYDTRGARLAGNFPQALTHLAVVTTALGLSGSVLVRGGG